jgi:hypothetical protein
MQATIEELLGKMFSVRSVQSGYKKKLVHLRIGSQIPEFQVSS